MARKRIKERRGKVKTKLREGELVGYPSEAVEAFYSRVADDQEMGYVGKIIYN